MHIHTFTHILIHTHTDTHTYIHTHTYILHPHTYIHTCIRMNTHIHEYLPCIYMHPYTYIHTHTYIRTHLHSHTHIHIYANIYMHIYMYVCVFYVLRSIFGPSFYAYLSPADNSMDVIAPDVVQAQMQGWGLEAMYFAIGSVLPARHSKFILCGVCYIPTDDGWHTRYCGRMFNGIPPVLRVRMYTGASGWCSLTCLLRGIPRASFLTFNLTARHQCAL